MQIWLETSLSSQVYENYFSEYFVNYESLTFEGEVVAYKPKNLKEYGLDKPQFEVKFKYYQQEEVKDNKDSGVMWSNLWREIVYSSKFYSNLNY